MNGKRERMADYITRRAFPDPSAAPARPPARLTFIEWSRKTERTPFVPKSRASRLGVTTRLMACVYPWQEIEIEVGESFASIALNRAVIRFPTPFDENGLTDTYREFIIEAVRQAIARDGLHRSITWPEPPSPNHGDPA